MVVGMSGLFGGGIEKSVRRDAKGSLKASSDCNPRLPDVAALQLADQALTNPREFGEVILTPPEAPALLGKTYSERAGDHSSILISRILLHRAT